MFHIGLFGLRETQLNLLLCFLCCYFPLTGEAAAILAKAEARAQALDTIGSSVGKTVSVYTLALLIFTYRYRNMLRYFLFECTISLEGRRF